MSDDEPDRKSIMVPPEVHTEFKALHHELAPDKTQWEFLLMLLEDRVDAGSRLTPDEVREIIREELRRVLPDELVAPPR